MSLKIAIVTKKLTVKGGAELAILELAKNFGCDIFTSDYNQDATYKDFSNLDVYFSPLKFNGNLPLLLKFINFPFIRELRKYDLIITTSGFYPKLIAVHRNLPQIIHFEQSPTNFNAGFARFISPLDFYATKRITRLVALSQNIRQKMLMRYSRDSTVVSAPVDVKRFINAPSEDFFLSVQRITADKRLHLQVEAFNKLPRERLIIVAGSYDQKYFNRIKKSSPKNVEFSVGLEREQIIELYSKCKATIQTSKDEPFGFVPIESMAAGKPCIAVNEGGFRETIIDGKTGIFIQEPYVDTLITAIKNIDKYNFDSGILRERAEELSLDNFITNFKRVFDDILG
ncbi:MAG: glycosyltransferase [Methanomicrobia archaeon]|nr:glycosyltransferase [Methanomicrobia archaeon]